MDEKKLQYDYVFVNDAGIIYQPVMDNLWWVCDQWDTEHTMSVFMFNSIFKERLIHLAHIRATANNPLNN